MLHFTFMVLWMKLSEARWVKWCVAYFPVSSKWCLNNYMKLKMHFSPICTNIYGYFFHTKQPKQSYKDVHPKQRSFKFQDQITWGRLQDNSPGVDSI